MNAEQAISYFLNNKAPKLKRVLKRCYQIGMYIISPKVKSEGNIVCVSPQDSDKEYFFGYYDKSPWDADDRYMLCLSAKNTWKEVAPKDIADILLIDTFNDNKVEIIGKTSSWNVQQGCMLQWLGPDFKSKIIYNDFRNGNYCAVIKEIELDKERILPLPVYSVSADGKTALSLDFSRLHRLRKGYGYSNITDKTSTEKIPEGVCVWRMDLESGDVQSILTYKALVELQPEPSMQQSEHKVNHIMISPNGKRFMMLHRWLEGVHKHTRLVTCNVDGTGLYVLNDDDVSHCYWKNDQEIIAFAEKAGDGFGYYLMKDMTKEYKKLWRDLNLDGHPSYSPNGKYVVTDTYPNRARVAEVMVLEEAESAKKRNVVARVFAPFKYDNETRCDLHPRWSRDGEKICFDGVFEGHRGLYVVEASVDE